MRMGRVSNLLLLATSVGWLTTAALMPAQKTAAAQPKVSFARDVLPILSDKCFLCHGPDSGSRMADLRLDLPKSAFADRGGRRAIVPGKPERSLVAKRISSHDTPMPP